MASFTKKISNIIKVEDNGERSLIVDSQVENSKVYSKNIANEGIYIYGHYNIYLLYKKFGYKNEVYNYKGRLITRDLCVVIPEEDILGNKINTNTVGNITGLSFKPSVKIVEPQERRHRDSINIEVYGEIKFQYYMKKATKINKTKTIEGQEILQFDSGRYSINELMDMDLKRLKEIYESIN
ncbi:hypothetical protein [Clostridium felsineum]|uniref:Uncharacterized protein n=1 Tax=Clostridium felsineum TaxID=36839 RepID=A0A1S8MCL4_9CLOT|nr:hypothetical protein [Clostridium felsineum]URZ07337.1 hypothetical protein CLROS_026750 [Clostridium felsineum]URZ12368.1 hypothetical protein CROST_030900 [Clostridium felsineum]URZ17030.1 hypothetical protein CLFE_030820 [Clostridium felsineum DSM 794]